MTVILTSAEIADSDGDVLALLDVPDRHVRSVLVEAQQRYKNEPENVEVGVAVRLNEDGMRSLVAWGQAWLDAPRDAARTAAEVVIDDTADDVRLLRTTLGEWGVGQVSADFDLLGEAIGDKVAVAWCADEAAARRMFAELRGKIVCFGCAVEVTEDDSEPATEDGDRYCPKCADEAREEFKATTFAHDAGSPGDGGCEWRGLGSQIVDFDEDALCPACGAAVQEVSPEPAS